MSCCGQENRITIVRGNDTNFNGQEFVRLNLTSEVWDLSTMKATIELGGIKKTYTDLSNGIELSYTAAETARMPFGDIDGVLKVYNQDEQIATIESLLPFRVISIVHGNAIAVTPAEFNIEVKQGGETVLNVNVEAGVTVEVGSTTTLPAGSSATVTNSGTANHLVLDFEIPQGEKGEQGEDGKDAKINGVNTLTLTTGDGLSLEQDGNTATIDLDSSVLLNYSDDDESIAIGGESSTSGGYAAAIGFGASAGMAGLAVGHYAKATDEAIQIGGGINNDSGTVQVLSYKLLDSSGIIPDARISSNIARTSALSDEITNRENADNGLQGQIDAITASSDVKDIVGTHAELEAYDTSTLGNNDIIKVLQDETHSNETTYYRWSTSTHTFTLIGAEGPYYTKSEANSTFVPQTRMVNGKALSSNISLTYTDVGAQVAGNYVTTDTEQTITQIKHMTGGISLSAVDDTIQSEISGSSTNTIKKMVLHLSGDARFAVIELNTYKAGTRTFGNILFSTRQLDGGSGTTDGQISFSTGSLIGVDPTQDTTSSKQLDTVGARNTKLANYELKSKPLNTLATSGTISPDTNTRNVVAPTGAITLNLPASPDATKSNEIELQVNQTSAVGFNFGSVLWGEDGTPDMSVGIWDFIFTYIAGNWCASYKKWETS